MDFDPTSGDILPNLMDGYDAGENALERPAMFTTEQLISMWDSVNAESHQWVKANGEAKWSATRGPIGATVLSLQRIGWQPIRADRWKDDRGVELDLGEFSPAMFALHLKAAIRRLAERKLAKKVGDQELIGRSACLPDTLHDALPIL